MGRKCGGYRNHTDLMFRDESAGVRRKAQRSDERRHASSSSSAAASHSAASDDLLRWSQHTNEPHLVRRFSTPTGEAFALCHFYQTTLDNLSEEDPTRYIFQQFPDLYSKSSPDCALRLATGAISYAALARWVDQAAHLSRRCYVRAIEATAKAILDESQVQTDQTLYAVLLLCGYEVSSFREESTAGAAFADVPVS